MTANELRINNRLYKNGIVVIIDGRSIMDIEYSADYAAQYSPIPLTPEILEKAGFVGEYKDYVKMEFKTSNGCISKSLKNNYAQICVQNYAAIDAPCQYVHQLQNLIFILTGHELEITF